MWDTYERGEQICKRWATQGNNIDMSLPLDRQNYEEDNTYVEDNESLSVSSNIGSTCSEIPCHQHNNNRNKFNCSMYDHYGRVTTAKVYSHQLKADFTINNDKGRHPSPNMFAASTNQVTDNAANAAQNFYDTHEHIVAYNCCYYPPFSSDWSFTDDGLINGKGATKTFYQKLDEELSLRLQHRPKQGLFQ
jgi:hypothetical protein